MSETRSEARTHTGETTGGGARLRQSFSWWSFAKKHIDPAYLIRTAARIGYAGVDMPNEEFWPLVVDAGLTIAAVGGHGTLTDGLNKRANHDRIAAEIETALGKAQKFGVPNLIVFSGNRDGLSDDEGAEATAEGLRRVAPLAEQAGVTLILELLNSKVDHPDYQADRTAWGVRVCEMVGSPRVRLLYDIYHMQVQEGDIIRNIRDHHAYLAHYHTAGVPGRMDLDEEQELYYPAVVRAVRATGFGGFLAHEFRPKGDPLRALEAAYRVCDV